MQRQTVAASSIGAPPRLKPYPIILDKEGQVIVASPFDAQV